MESVLNCTMWAEVAVGNVFSMMLIILLVQTNIKLTYLVQALPGSMKLILCAAHMVDFLLARFSPLLVVAVHSRTSRLLCPKEENIMLPSLQEFDDYSIFIFETERVTCLRVNMNTMSFR